MTALPIGPIGDTPRHLAYHLTYWHNFPLSDEEVERNFEHYKVQHETSRGFMHPNPNAKSPHTHDPKNPPYIWPDPNNPGQWIDAWNGSYVTLKEALEDAPAGVGRPWVLFHGEGLIGEDEMNSRLGVTDDHEPIPALVEAVERASETPVVPREYIIHESLHEKLDTIIELLTQFNGPMVLPGYSSVRVLDPGEQKLMRIEEIIAQAKEHSDLVDVNALVLEGRALLNQVELPMDGNDSTRLERWRTLRDQVNGLLNPPNPAICPECGPDAGIHVDADVRTRTAIMLESPNGSDPVVLVDRADGKAELLEIGIVECCRCGHEFDSEVFKNIVRDIVEDYQTTWRIMSDYRDM